MKQYKDKRAQGFTIIEVLIVLAIAGVIMLAVFLAVPNLQRNQRNQARNDDASRIAAAVTECLSNRNGAVASCNNDAAIEQGTVNQLETLNVETNGAATTPPASGLTAAGVWYGRICNAAGSASVAGGGTRSFVVLYTNEPAVTRCIGS